MIMIYSCTAKADLSQVALHWRFSNVHVDALLDIETVHWLELKPQKD